MNSLKLSERDVETRRAGVRNRKVRTALAMMEALEVRQLLAATHLAFDVAMADGVAGAMPAVTVKVLDENDAVVAGSSDLVTFSLDAGPAGVGLAVTVAAVEGVATLSGWNLTVAGAYALRAESGGLVAGVSSSFTVAAGAASKLAFTTGPADSVAGVPMAPVVVEVQDAYGNLVTNDTSSVTIALNGGARTMWSPLLGTLEVNAVGGVATFDHLMMQPAGSHTLAVTDGSLAPATSGSFTVVPGVADHFVCRIPLAPCVAGQWGDVVVTMHDRSGNVATNDTSNVTVTLNGTTGAPGVSRTVAGVAGVATFTDLPMTTAGAYTLNMSNGSFTYTSLAFFISPAAPAKVVFREEPDNRVSLELGTIRAEVRDVYDNPCTSDTSTVTLEQVSGRGVLKGTTAVAAAGGVATFTGISVSRTGGYVLRVSDGSLAADTTEHFEVGVRLVFQAQPETTTAGETMMPVIVRQVSAMGHTIMSDAPVTIALEGTTGTLYGTATVNAVDGVATFDDLSIRKAGVYCLTAESDGMTGRTSRRFTIWAGVATHMELIEDVSDVTAGMRMMPGVQVRLLDAYENVAVYERTPVTLNIVTGPAGGELGGTVRVMPRRGVATFGNLVIRKAGSYTLRVTAGSLAVDTSSFEVATGAATKLVIGQLAEAYRWDGPFPVPVAVTDRFGNVVDSEATILLRRYGAPAGSIPNNWTQAASLGSAVFWMGPWFPVGRYRLIATSPDLSRAVSSVFDVVVPLMLP